MTNTTQTTKALRLRRSAARKARVALAAAVVAAGLALPPLAAGMVAPPAHASTTFLVTNTNDSGAGSLRQAILDANSTPGADAINFAVEEAFRDPITGVATIKPQSALPAITEQVAIDGYSQEGAHANTLVVGDDALLKVELDGTNVPNANGLEVADSSGSVIRGLVINGFGEGIRIQGDSVANRVEGNFIGTDPTGTLDEGNHFEGVAIDGHPSESVVGGSTPAARNIISGNEFDGVVLSSAQGTLIQGNYVGTDKSGTKALGNDAGVRIADRSGTTTVGGTTAASRNVVSGNNSYGLFITGLSQGTKVLGDRIGTTADGKGALGNDEDGVIILSGAGGTLIGDGTSGGSNTIAFNGGTGVSIAGTGTGNELSRDSIFSNAALGIDLNHDGLTPNDARDGDSGPNGLQNKPILTSAKASSTNTTVAGTLNSAPNKTFVVRLFSNPAGGEEGKRFLGKKSVLTDGKGNVTFTKALAKVPVGNTVTATATDPAGNTSEFSAPRTVASV